jgi:hypothetical protein
MEESVGAPEGGSGSGKSSSEPVKGVYWRLPGGSPNDPPQYMYGPPLPWPAQPTGYLRTQGTIMVPVPANGKRPAW